MLSLFCIKPNLGEKLMEFSDIQNQLDELKKRLDHFRGSL